MLLMLGGHVFTTLGYVDADSDALMTAGLVIAFIAFVVVFVKQIGEVLKITAPGWVDKAMNARDKLLLLLLRCRGACACCCGPVRLLSAD